MISQPRTVFKRPDYAGFVAAQSRMGNYFSFHRDWVGTFSTREVVLLSHLLNVGKQQNGPGGGWIMATPSFVRKGTGIPGRVQDKVLASLVHKGIVEARVIDGRRHVRIDVERIEDLLE